MSFTVDMSNINMIKVSQGLADKGKGDKMKMERGNNKKKICFREINMKEMFFKREEVEERFKN